MNDMPKKIMPKYDSRDAGHMRKYLHTVFIKQGMSDEVAGETALWQAVVVQAVMDVLSNAKCPKARRAKKQAINWLKKTNEDFLAVCSFAGFDPDFVIRGMKRALYRYNNKNTSVRRNLSDGIEGSNSVREEELFKSIK